jgi:hypothetical protein
MLIVIMNVIMLSVVMLNVIMQSGVVLNVIMVSVVMLNVVAPYRWGPGHELYFFLLS